MAPASRSTRPLALQNDPLMKIALDNMQELRNFYKSSGKFKHMCLNMQANANMTVYMHFLI